MALGEWVQGEGIFATEPLGMWLQGTCPGKKVLAEKSLGAGLGRGHRAGAAEPFLPPLPQRHLRREHGLSGSFALGVRLGLPPTVQLEKAFVAVSMVAALSVLERQKGRGAGLATGTGN